MCGKSTCTKIITKISRVSVSCFLPVKAMIFSVLLGGCFSVFACDGAHLAVRLCAACAPVLRCRFLFAPRRRVVPVRHPSLVPSRYACALARGLLGVRPRPLRRLRQRTSASGDQRQAKVAASHSKGIPQMVRSWHLPFVTSLTDCPLIWCK